MYEENVHGYYGHSNDSLFASADEMAGHYTPRNDNNAFTSRNDNNAFTPRNDTNAFTPRNDTNAFTPRNDTNAFTPRNNTNAFTQRNDNNAFTPTHLNKTIQPPTSRGSIGHRPTRSIDSEDMELNYPLPDEPEIWRQAEHPDSINKLLNVTGDMCQETFRGAAQMLSHANPETFEMPLEARIICMKVDRESDMRYCLTNGAVTNLPGCNERINTVWRERDGQRVFMMFSISSAKEFCAMAEVCGPVQEGSMPGWSKPGCEGLVLLTFIYVKNVPFKLINHIKHKSNRQPVANMWNSMLYQDNTGYHVAKIFCEHPVLSSVLVKIRTETLVNYKSQLRIPTSGNTTYSVSSFTSENDKSHDPRSATKPTFHRSGNRSQKSNVSSWRSHGVPPTPSRQAGPVFNAGTYATPNPVAPHQYAMNQQNVTGVTQSPPPFMMPNSGSGGFRDARSFLTADDRMIAEFAHSRDEKRSEANQTVPSGFQHAEAASRDPFSAGRTAHTGQNHNLPANNPNRHGQSHHEYVGRTQAGYDAQWQGHGRFAPTPDYSADPAAGYGNPLAATGPHNRPSPQPFNTTNAMPPQLPFPVTSSHASRLGSTQAHGIRKQQSQGFALGPPPSYNSMRSRRGHGHPAPQPIDLVSQKTFENPLHSRQQQVLRSGSPIKQSQSMPLIMANLTQHFSAQNLRAQNTDANADNLATVPVESSIQTWVDSTPIRDTFAPTKLSFNNELAVKTSTDHSEKFAKPPHSADIVQQLEWYQNRAGILDALIKADTTKGRPAPEDEVLELQHCISMAGCLKIEIHAAHRDHVIGGGENAGSTKDSPTVSRGTPCNSDDVLKKANSSGIESDNIEPVYDEDSGKIFRSVSKDREKGPTYISEKQGHRRNNVEGFTASFDQRMKANAQDVIRTPTRISGYSSSRAARDHGHPRQRTLAPPDYGQYDSCTEDQQCNEYGHYGYSHNNNAFDAASQAEDDEVFPSRGRSYPHAHPGYDAFQMSYNGGFGFGYGPGQQ